MLDASAGYSEPKKFIYRNKKRKNIFLVFLETKVLCVVCFRVGFSQISTTQEEKKIFFKEKEKQIFRIEKRERKGKIVSEKSRFYFISEQNFLIAFSVEN